MAIGDAYKLTAFGTSVGQQVMNTLNFTMLSASDPDATTLLVLANDWKNTWQPWQHSSAAWTSWTFTQQWGPLMTIDSPRCRRLGGKAFAGVFTPPLQGALGLNQGLPPQCAAVVTQLTGFTGRRHRGRVYVFGLGEGDQSAGTWDTAALGNWTGALNTFFGKYRQGGTNPTYQLSVWSERTATGCVPKVPPPGHIQVDTPHPELASTPVTGYTLRPTVYTQRRRTIGVGR